MNDTGMKRVIAFATENEAFAALLLSDRAAALSEMDLSPEERAILLAASDEQLGQMIAQARKRPWLQRQTVSRVMAGTAIVLGTVGGIIYPMTLTAGIRIENNRSHQAATYLHSLSNMEEQYHQTFGIYADLDTLVTTYKQQELLERFSRQTCHTFSIELNEDGTYQARATDLSGHTPGWVSGPDGAVQKLKEK